MNLSVKPFASLTSQQDLRSPHAHAALARPTPEQARTLLETSTQISVQLITGAFPYMLEQVLDTLNQSWDFAPGSQLTRRFLADQGQALVRRFSEQLPLALQQAVTAFVQRAQVRTALQWDADHLELLDVDSDPAQFILLESARHVQAHTDDSLREWHLVASFICTRDELPLTENPFVPHHVVAVLLQAARDLGLASEAWPHFLQAFEADLGAEIRRVFQALLDHMRVHGYDARQIRRTLQALQTQSRLNDAKAAPVFADTATPTEPTVHGAPAIQRPLSAQATPQTAVHGAGSATPAARADRAGVPSTVPAPDSAIVLQALLGRLKGMGGSEGGSVSEADVPQLPPGQAAPELLNAIAELQSLGLEGVQGSVFAGTSAGSLRAWREHLIEHSDRTVDKLTIEIVSMMFDHVLRDEQVPSEIKALLSRLQFPVLKAALLDADFFASGTHPARRLIDRIASTSIGWEPYGDENDRYRREIDRLVNQIILQFDQDLTLFERILGEFDAFLADAMPRESDPIARAKRALEEAEKREILTINLTIQVRKVFERVPMEDWLRQFLLGPWVRVLVAATVRDSGTPGFSKAFRQSMHDMLWSIQPKATAEERRRLVQLIPSLSRTLRDGLALIQFPQRELDDFMQQLMAAQAFAVKPTEGTPSHSDAQVHADLLARIDAMQIAQSIPMASVPGGLRVSPETVHRAASDHNVVLRMPPAQPDALPADRQEQDKLDQRISDWKRGSWFQLWDGKAFIKAQLRWISPLRTLFLFSGGSDHNPHVLSPEMVRSYVRRRFIRSLEPVTLTQRAATAVLDDFERVPAHTQRLTTQAAGSGSA